MLREGMCCCRSLLLICVAVMLFWAVGSANAASDRTAAVLPDMQHLLLQGLSSNSGLQAYRIDPRLAAEDVNVEASRFDLNLFADTAVARSRAQLAEQTFNGTIDSELIRAEVGVGKQFNSGLQGTVSLSSERGESDDSALDPYYRSSLNFELQQPLLRDFGQRVNTTAVEVARHRLQQSQSLFLQQARDLALQIELAGYDLLKARQTEILREQARELVVELLQANRTRLDAGVISISEVQEAETALAGSDLEVALSRQASERLVHQLDGLVNDHLAAGLKWSPESIEQHLSVDWTLPSFDQLYRQALSTRSDIQQLAEELKSLALQRTYQENQTRPRLDLLFDLQLHGLSGTDDVGSLPGTFTGPYFDSYQGMADADGYNWTAGIAFSYPLGNRKARAEAEQSRLAIRRLEFQKHELEKAVETQLLQLLTDLKRVGERVVIAQRYEDLAEKTLQQENRRLDEGLSDTFRVLSFQGTLIEARIERLAAQVDYQVSYVRLQRLLGTNIERHGIRIRFAEKETRFELL